MISSALSRSVINILPAGERARRLKVSGEAKEHATAAGEKVKKDQ